MVAKVQIILKNSSYLYLSVSLGIGQLQLTVHDILHAWREQGDSIASNYVLPSSVSP